ncbi:MAG: hypothetical protein J7M38_06565 [Armatimonadetes bacterium]|nr:hypothetical protein [Armatimonadota bacterium]
MSVGGDYYLWLRILNFQEQETKRLYMDGKFIGQVTGVPDASGSYVWRGLNGPVRLTAGEHTLRIEFHGIAGHADPVNYIYLTRDPEIDPATLGHDPTAPIVSRPPN